MKVGVSLICYTFIVSFLGFNYPDALGGVQNPEGLAFAKAADDDFKNTDWTKAVYVSPSGNDSATGTKENPFLTVKQALTKLPPEGGIVALLSGIYTESVISIAVPEGYKGMLKALTICAAPGEKPVFDGSEEIADWTVWNEQRGVYVVTLDRASKSLPEVWEATGRFRFRPMLDAEGVNAYPGSCAFIDPTHLVLHTRANDTPKEAGLRLSVRDRVFYSTRPKTILRGLTFQNFVGWRFANGADLRGNDSMVGDCQFYHMHNGVNIGVNAQRVRVTRCQFEDVCSAVVTLGIDTEITDCLCQAAVGDFAFQVDGQERTGIRYYAPAQGGVILRCVAMGFWFGIFLKESDEDPARHPLKVDHNTLIDGLGLGGGAGPSHQSHTTIENNLIALGQDYPGSVKGIAESGASCQGNYFFPAMGMSPLSDAVLKDIAALGKGNVAGPIPFADLAAGNLTPDSGIAALAKGSDVGAGISHVNWSSSWAQLLNHPPAPPATPKLAFKGPAIAASSTQGAVVTIEIEGAANGKLKYRKVGEESWMDQSPLDNSQVSYNGGSNVTTPIENIVTRWTFSLINHELVPKTEYEYQIEASDVVGNIVQTGIQKLKTVGGPKDIYVSAGATSKNAAGSKAHPYNTIQSALERALPGDTIRIGKGVYTGSAILLHGGNLGHPLTIEGAGENATILDGGKYSHVLLELHGAKYVTVKNMTFRWFLDDGFLARECDHITVENCRAQNELFTTDVPTGDGIVFLETPDSTIRHCIATRTQHGLSLNLSPGATIENNTAFMNLYSGLTLLHSAEGSKITYNSFAYNALQQVVLFDPEPEKFSSLVSDYNNYGTTLRSEAPERPENDFGPAKRYQIDDWGSKWVINFVHKAGEWTEFYRLGAWQQFSGKDAHSIFADPQYIDPRNGNFDVPADSPNVLRASGGKKVVIGAKPISNIKLNADNE